MRVLAEDDAVAECAVASSLRPASSGAVDEEELVAQSRCAVNAWEDGAGSGAGEGGEDLTGSV